MDHKAFVAGLPRQTLAELNATKDRPGLLHLAMHIGLLILFALWIAKGWLLWPFAMVAQGVTLCFLFTLEHEATHKTPFKTLLLNEWVGTICGVLILLPFTWFRYFHLAHHKFTNIPGKDPELLAGAKPETWSAYITHVSGLPYWWGMIRQVFGNALGHDTGDYVPERAKPKVITEARWMLSVYALFIASLFLTPLLFWVWLLPCVLGQPFLRLYLLAEHGRCAFVANMFENTRTTYTNRVIRFLAWNMPYHVEHHAMPQVPFHKLPALNKQMQGNHQITADGYAGFTRDYARDLR